MGDWQVRPTHLPIITLEDDRLAFTFPQIARQLRAHAGRTAASSLARSAAPKNCHPELVEGPLASVGGGGICAAAQFNLAAMYANGGTVPKDHVRAYAWINLAAASNFPGAAEERDAMEPKLAPEQKDEAQKLSAELSEKIKTHERPSVPPAPS